jgi:hypothetical protein
MGLNNEYIKREFYCRICKKTHKINLNKKIMTRESKFPITHIYLHGELKNILTTLYIDKDLQIRGVDVHELHDDDIFSKDHVTKLINTLMGEIERLQRENARLTGKLHSIKDEID